MKKLIIAAAIVCAAVVSQAAAIEWMAMDLKDITGEQDYTGSAVLTVWNSTGGSTTYNGSATMGMIDEFVGDGSAADAGFIKSGEMYSMQFTMTDAAGNVYTSELATDIMGMYPSSNMAFFTEGSWAAVPEPTSGLLLLLGVAGLALKRKRA